MALKKMPFVIQSSNFGVDSYAMMARYERNSLMLDKKCDNFMISNFVQQ